MNRTLSRWMFGVVDDTAQAALMLVLAGAALSLQQQDRRSEPQHPGRPVPARQRGALLGDRIAEVSLTHAVLTP